MFGRQAVAVFCIFLIQPAFAAEAPVNNAADILDRMSKAMQSEAYMGTFIYRHKNKVETLKIIRRNQSGHIDERLITLSGKPREIIRSGAVVTCIWPDSKLAMVDSNRTRSNFPGLLFEDLSKVTANYNLQVSEQSERIAGRDCLIVDVLPKDKFRYGYRLWVDRENYLLVRSDLLNKDNEPLEQVIFTELNIYESLPDEMFEPELMQADFRKQKVGTEKQIADTDTAKSDSSPWKVNQLPAGFALQLYRQKLWKGNNALVEHMVFSDGLASVSVFIGPAEKDRFLRPSQHRGGLNVYSKIINGNSATIVGEVPQETIELIAESIQYETGK